MAGRTHSLAGCGRRCRHGRRLFPLEGDFGRIGVRLRRPRLILLWLTLAITLIAAPSAHAHLMNTGFGPFYDGLTHLFVTPEDLLPVIALALLAGLRGPRFGRAVLFALPVAWLVGSAAGLLLAPQVTLPVAETIVTIALGALLAADCPLPFAAVGGLAILLGLLHGSLNGSELPKTNASGQNFRRWRCGCALCRGVALGRTGRLGACPVGADCRPGGRELDCCNRLTSPRLVTSLRAFMKNESARRSSKRTPVAAG